MEKTILVLPNGIEISSGRTDADAVLSFSLTQCVNEEEELTLGSVCAAMAEITVLCTGDLPLQEGQELTVYREDTRGIRRKIGVFLIMRRH